MTISKNEGWIGVDLDGTLAHQPDTWEGHANIGAPIAPMVDRVKLWLDEGREVRILTSRVDGQPPESLPIARLAIQQWCIKHIGSILPITNCKDMYMLQLWDDRAVQVVFNTGEPIEVCRCVASSKELKCQTIAK